MKNMLNRWQRRRKLKRLKRKKSKVWKTLRWTGRIILVLIATDLFYVMIIWPDWKQYASDKIPKSRFIENYEQRVKEQPNLPELKWKPVSFNWIPPHLRRAVIAAEDARFYHHNGFDIIAFKEAMDVNLELMKFKYGASTISQQTVKNLFFSSSKNPLRKWHELLLTFGMEQNLSKNRILSTYLNIAEFGKGIYGVEAAAHHYFGIPVYSLTKQQAAELAATLPSPIKHNPTTRTNLFLKRARRIHHWMEVQQIQ